MKQQTYRHLRESMIGLYETQQKLQQVRELNRSVSLKKNEFEALLGSFSGDFIDSAQRMFSLISEKYQYPELATFMIAPCKMQSWISHTKKMLSMLEKI